MTVEFYSSRYKAIPKSDLLGWRDISAAEASDCLGRFSAMRAIISPLNAGMKVLGSARTVKCMAGDNSALHAALKIANPGDIIVADGQGFEDRAVWGGLMTRLAKANDIGGLVLDGAVRDSQEIIELGFPCFARGVVPGGPHKAFGGTIDETISCGGIPVSPGDLVIGDADGVTIVPRGRMRETLAAVAVLKEKENLAVSMIEKGESIGAIYGVPSITDKPD